jgi:hypothetical protein
MFTTVLTELIYDRTDLRQCKFMKIAKTQQKTYFVIINYKGNTSGPNYDCAVSADSMWSYVP